ncbi:MAG: xanthine phosphoribosyltransferase [Lachnospiraceae bacterium]|nr:xanthine phosphoribosyltransferase [Lachnospiraceae bacterium]
MRLLEERILKDGKVRAGGILKVDGFLNHQMDVHLFMELAKQWKEAFEGEEITKLLTIEASGIGLACIAAQVFDCPVVFAKKTKTRNIDGSVYKTQVKSFTHGKIYDVIVSREYLRSEDRVLLIDDFLADGAALDGLCDLVRQSGAVLVGAGIAIEKCFQPGGKRLRDKGLRIESLARVKAMYDDGRIEFD